MFWKKKSLPSEDYEKLSKAILETDRKLEQLKVSVEALGSNLKSLRGLVNRKIGGEKEETEEDESSIKSENLTIATRKKFGIV